MSSELPLEVLRERARDLRCDIIRMISEAGSGHPGGSLSIADLVAYLYFYRLRIDPSNPAWPDRDRMVLSKGHSCPAVYTALAAKGYFPREVLWTLRDTGSILQGHPDMTKTPGIDMTTGTLGQGFSCAVGMALGGKLSKKDSRVYTILGDGEVQAGQVWEAAMAAAHYRLDNLIVVLDYNKLQVDGPVARIMGIEPLVKKWTAFGWDATEIDGHAFDEIHQAFERCMERVGRPHVIVAHTIKGKGVACMEDNVAWHARPPSKDEAVRFIAELNSGGPR